MARILNVRRGLPRGRKSTITTVDLGKKAVVAKGIAWPEEAMWTPDGQIIVYNGWPADLFGYLWYEWTNILNTATGITAEDLRMLVGAYQEYSGRSLEASDLMVDVHAGRGRVGLAAIQEGYTNWVGLEEDRTSRQIAQQQARALGIRLRMLPVFWWQHPLLLAIKGLNGKAKLVSSLFNSFGYRCSLKECQEEFQRFSDLLEPEGLLVFDIRWGPKLRQKFQVPQPLYERKELTLPAGMVVENWRQCTQDGVVRTASCITYRGKVVHRLSYGWCTFVDEEIREMMAAVGLELLERRLARYPSSAEDDRAIYIARKLS